MDLDGEDGRARRPGAARRAGGRDPVSYTARVLTLAVGWRWHAAAGVHVRLRLQVADDRVPVEDRHGPRVILLGRDTVASWKPGQLAAALVPGLLLP